MKNFFCFFFCVFMFLSVDSFASENLENLTPTQKNYVVRYVQAINSKDENQLKALMHPGYLSCINDSNKDYFEDAFQRSLRNDIPEDYKGSVVPLEEEDILKEVDGAQQLGLSYPVKPTHQLQIDFNESEYSSVTIIRKLVQEGDSFYETLGCPSAEAVAKFREIKLKKDADHLRAKELFYELKDPLFSELTNLINEGREMEAWRKYSEATGETLAMAKEVLFYIPRNSKQ